MWIDQEPLKLQAKLFGLSSAEDAENLIRAAYKQFIRFNNVAAIRQEDDGYVVEIWFIKDNHSTSNTQILNEFRSYGLGWRSTKGFFVKTRLQFFYELVTIPFPFLRQLRLRLQH